MAENHMDDNNRYLYDIAMTIYIPTYIADTELS